MESMADSCERLIQKKSTKLTLFEDLLQPSNPQPNPNSMTSDYREDSCPSDCESVVSGLENEPLFGSNNNNLIRIGNEDMIYATISKKLVSNLKSNGFTNAEVEAIHRRDYSGIMSQAKLQSFCIYAKAVGMKCGYGNANVKYAWYGAGKKEITGILSHGFCFPANSPQGVSLSPADHPNLSVQSSAADDDDGLRHLLLCRVILGKAEVISPGSGQCNPSSEEFDSGVDNLLAPGRYVVWNSCMNTHILPEFVVSFRATPSCRGCERMSQPTTRTPHSHWMPFPALIAALAKFLPADAVGLISRHYGDYKKKKIPRYEMIQKVRKIAGDDILMSIIKFNRRK
ncbi:probable inactive poly [ADP-ribose] polymerase SRO5 isoform X1 [Andrographis paniculata]|uniref:probable inactive poly [ADP-ribose] polymerase SRO5 isoform X1 n=1 Tax=Andrographis paniculata TaxID=175694 RepID=UPI0021E88FF9|nr:probable inactive poly [ADP-ribose] polymerase SRO5 isoform X1 [Andrographis paniculata]XP_051133383.1 probable inactive poly [ADP-ribose] polymerase SRO5 isoform X1 [Andrographis paniculata]